MFALPRTLWALPVLLAARCGRSIADEPPTCVEIGKIGKAGTALVELKERRAYGFAFCGDPAN
jgi:hypothetical protein